MTGTQLVRGVCVLAGMLACLALCRRRQSRAHEPASRASSRNPAFATAIASGIRRMIAEAPSAEALRNDLEIGEATRELPNYSSTPMHSRDAAAASRDRCDPFLFCVV